MFFKKLSSYIVESISEMKKVVWPSKKQTITYTIVVFALSAGTAIFFAVLDDLFNRGFSVLIK